MVVHKIGASCIRHDGMTTCGIVAYKTIGAGEYLAYDKSNPIKAVYGSWDGVTCKSCLRNPHAPGGRFSQARSHQRS